MYEQAFINSIHNQTKVALTFFSKEKSRNLTRLCAPLDYGPSRRAYNKADRYHFWDYEADKKNHNISLLPEQIINMEFTSEAFNPSVFVTKLNNWIVPRDWIMRSY
ncbi:MAG: hypothetical protein ACI9W6_000767 [Motiliproteus sp.]|jgi:hypothetical protein